VSVATSLRFTRRSWNTTPFDAVQPTGLPGGYWVASATSEGDASGGVSSFQHIFSNPVGIGRRDNNFYSLEEMCIADSLDTAHEYHLEINQMDSDALDQGGIRPVIRHYTINAQAHGVTTANEHALNIWRANQTRIWIGRYHGLDTEFGDILVETDNVTAGEMMQVILQGLWWPPGAENGPRGIIRPTDTIYGA